MNTINLYSEETLGNVRRIASEWHGGMWSALYALASSGAIRPGVSLEIAQSLDHATDPEDVRDLLALRGWVDMVDHVDAWDVAVGKPNGYWYGWADTWSETWGLHEVAS